MGEATNVICTSCGTKYVLNKGGSMHCELFHCDMCGKEKWLEEYTAWHVREVFQGLAAGLI